MNLIPSSIPHGNSSKNLFILLFQFTKAIGVTREDMSRLIRVRYEEGVLRPLEPLDLRERSLIEVKRI